VLGALLAGFGLFALLASTFGGVLILGACAILLISYFSFSSTYEFYKKGLIRKVRGASREAADYASVTSYHYNPSTSPFRSP
jgi:hypothetical protein